MPSGGRRKGAGRKHSPYTERKELRLKPEHAKWIDGQPGTVPEIIDRLITDKLNNK